MANIFRVQLRKLIAEPEFVRLISLSTEPNFFKVVGQSRYERWHSAFWGWLIDPGGSHLLGNYILDRLITLLFSGAAIRPKDSDELETQLLSRVSLDDVDVRPNENDHSELVIDAGRLDIFATGKLDYADNSQRKFHLLIEVKVDSRTRAEQSKNYADWLLYHHSKDASVLLYILPNREMRSTSEGTVGDPRWFCLDFQQLHDEILLPTLAHPRLNPRVAPFVEQYIRNLRIPYKGNKMAITQEERELARALYDKYSDVFETISEALQYENIEINFEDVAASGGGRSSGRLAVKIDSQELEGRTVPELFTSSLKYLVDTDALDKVPLPWGRGTNRYIIAKGPDPIHPSGRSFFAPVEYKGYVLESHMERQRAFTVLSQLCKYLELEFAIVES